MKQAYALAGTALALAAVIMLILLLTASPPATPAAAVAATPAANAAWLSAPAASSGADPGPGADIADHDKLLAAQNLGGTPDAGRLAIWQQQRLQLRVRMLGERVTEEWFGSEDAYLSQALAELALTLDGPPPNGDEVLHRAHMQQVLREAAFSARGP